jgi:predicted ribosome quality control (RQC) complex YloA/Tae2 family protein
VIPLSLDGIAIRALIDEIEHLLIGGRIDKIQQPDNWTIIFTIRQPGKNYKLLLTINPQSARFHMTQTTRPNPTHPPLFCMVLRKHLEGSKLTNITQFGLERIVHFVFEGFNELGEKVTRTLIGEFMGKHSNLILVNHEKNFIIDSIKRLSESTNQYRQVLPGIPYVSPPPQNKLTIEEIRENELTQELLNSPPEQKVEKALLKILSGIGPQTAKELTIRAGFDSEARLEFFGEYDYLKIWQEIKWLKSIIKNKTYEPVLVFDNDSKPIAFAPFYLQQFISLEQKTFPSMSELIEFYIGKSEEKNLFKQKVLNLEKTIDKELERCQRKLVLQLEKQAEGQASEKYKLWGELLTANLYNLKQGENAKVTNFYSEKMEEIEIPMEPNLTPNENAQKYFKKYTKAKLGAKKALEQSKFTLEEINYLETIKNSLEKAENLNDLQEIRWELEEAGYLKAKPIKNKNREKTSSQIQPISVEKSGFRILVGKNNKQNDYLTLKIAKNEDLWLHVKDIPGSHVIIKNPGQKEIPKDILDTAANLAAYFSKSRYSAQVPVDYTLKKYVKKPSGAKPGMVIYENQKTVYITPDEEKVLELINKPSS